MPINVGNEDRIFARRMARELRGDEIAEVTGGAGPPSDICWYSNPYDHKDEKVLGIDPD